MKNRTKKFYSRLRLWPPTSSSASAGPWGATRPRWPLLNDAGRRAAKSEARLGCVGRGRHRGRKRECNRLYFLSYFKIKTYLKNKPKLMER